MAGHRPPADRPAALRLRPLHHLDSVVNLDPKVADHDLTAIRDLTVLRVDAHCLPWEAR
jgi:hypothetical protein